MPGQDQTGPEGEGPKTGRQMGRCAGNDVPDVFQTGREYTGRCFARRGIGGRSSKGRRGGWRRRNWFYATGVPGWARFGPDASSADVPSADETESLEARAERLRGELDAIDQRLQELDPRD